MPRDDDFPDILGGEDLKVLSKTQEHPLEFPVEDDLYLEVGSPVRTPGDESLVALKRAAKKNGTQCYYRFLEKLIADFSLLPKNDSIAGTDLRVSLSDAAVNLASLIDDQLPQNVYEVLGDFFFVNQGAS